MSIRDVIFRSTLLATCIFWIVIISEGIHPWMIVLITLSMVPIGICCSLTIFLTILPFFRDNGIEHKDKKIIFNTFFPFYSIVCFSICFYGLFKEPDIACFWISAFFTSLQSWVWLATDNKKTPQS